MEMNQELFNQLVVLRDKLKDEATKNGNHFYISDSVLEQIALYKPEKKSDFESISGVGPAFIENYADSFLEIIKPFIEKPEDSVELNKRGIAVLQDFEKKLVNLNKRNHLLYCGKLYNKFGIDLVKSPNDIRNIILGSGRTANVAKANDANYKPIISLLRNNARNLREKGQNNLFVAYPFVKGKFAGDDFSIRAPLALFPVKGERSSSGIKLSLDKDREVLYNTTLILANYKFNGINKPLPEADIEDTSRETFIDSLLKFYSDNKIKIKMPEIEKDAALLAAEKNKKTPVENESTTNPTESTTPAEATDSSDSTKPAAPAESTGENPEVVNTPELSPTEAEVDVKPDTTKPDATEQIPAEPDSQELPDSPDLQDSIDSIEQKAITALPIEAFENYSADSFPKFKKGQFVLENSAVLGLFPITSSSIQKDFQQIVASKKINKLLDDLLGNKDYTPFDGDKIQDVSEKDIVYINKLDAAQENVISALSTKDELVVQGPPGTGKSQTITSLIASFATTNKSILLVSEKKTALDVVYSRLGNLSKYAMLLDDCNDKVNFYNQLSVMAQLSEVAPGNTEELTACEEEIDELFGKLGNIDSAFYKPDDFGIEPYKLYLLCNLQAILQKENLKKIRKYKAALTPKKSAEAEAYKFTYQVALDSNNFYKNEENLNKVREYLNLEKTYSWLAKARQNLTDFELQDASIDFDKIAEDKEERNNQKFMKKIFSKNQVRKDLKEFVDKYFAFEKEDKKLSRKYSKLFYKNQEQLVQGFEEYENFWALREFYDEVEEGCKKYYSAMEILLPLVIEKENVQLANNELFFYLTANHLIELESKYRQQIPDLEHFEVYLQKIDVLMAKKRQLEKQRLENCLAENISILSKSKRRSEILKQIEAKRKWSVNKFINKFNFELFNAVKIWLLTPEVVSEIIPLEAGFFDLVVFDEASQMFVEKGLPSILRGKKVVIAGDQNQLRPSNLFTGRFEKDENAFDQDTVEEDEEIAIATDEESLLDLARFKYDKVLLNFHYRSKYEELIAFSNYAFYEGKLNVSPNCVKPELPPIQVHKIEDALWTKRANEAEAAKIVEIIKDFFANRQNNETIGVITFNTNQRDKIDDFLDKECENDPEFAKNYNAEIVRKENGQDIGLFVKNIETVQGDERDVIIFSMGYAKNEEGKFVQNFGWLNQAGGENRLNVAVSRAKQKIHIVVSFDPSELKMENAKNNGPETLKKYLEYAFAVSDNDIEKEKLLLNSFVEPVQQESAASSEEKNDNSIIAESLDTAKKSFEEEIEKFLLDHGYEFDRNIGIGGYTIDYAIKNDGQYVLGLECDGPLYDNSFSARERDYYRQKYLEARGWKLYRIWTMLWKKNPERAGKKLLKCLENCTKD